MLPLEIENIIKDYIMDLNILEKKKNINKELKVFFKNRNLYCRVCDNNLSISNLENGYISIITSYPSINKVIIRNMNFYESFYK